MATTIHTGTSTVTVLNARERVTGRRGYWEVRQNSDQGSPRIVIRTKREALRVAANCARAERRVYRAQAAAHVAFTALPADERGALLVAMNTGRQSDRDAARRRFLALGAAA